MGGAIARCFASAVGRATIGSMAPETHAVTHHTVTLKHLRMHFVEAGQGPLVILLHGFPESWWSWRHQLGPLSAEGFRVVAPDLRGYGDSGTEGPYNLDTLVDDVCQLIEHLGESPAFIVGHDWGGAVAWHLAGTRPSYCRSLTVLNCPHPALMRQALLSQPSWAQLKKSWYFFFFQLPAFPEWALTRKQGLNVERTIKAASVQRAHTTSAELKPFRDNILKPGRAKAMVDWYRTIVKENLKHPFSQMALPRIETSTLLLWGMEDPALGYHELVPGTERIVPNLVIEQIPGVGHFVQSEAPDIVNDALVRFFKKASPFAEPAR